MSVTKVRRGKTSGGNPKGRWSGTKNKKLREIVLAQYGDSMVCWICNQPVSKDSFTIDHVVSARKWPEFAFEPSNLRPAHSYCNQARDWLSQRNAMGFKTFADRLKNAKVKEDYGNKD